MSVFAGYAQRARVAGILVLGLALSGCSVYHDEVGGNFSKADLSALGAAGGIPFQVNGIVGGAQGAPLAAAVASGMPASVGGTAVHYSACTPYTECAGDHVVWTFGPPAVRSALDYPAALHVGPDLITTYHAPSTLVTVKVAVFQNGTVVSSASGQVDAPNGAGDPAFQGLISEMSGAVFSHGILDVFQAGLF